VFVSIIFVSSDVAKHRILIYPTISATKKHLKYFFEPVHTPSEYCRRLFLINLLFNLDNIFVHFYRSSHVYHDGLHGFLYAARKKLPKPLICTNLLIRHAGTRGEVPQGNCVPLSILVLGRPLNTLLIFLRSLSWNKTPAWLVSDVLRATLLCHTEVMARSQSGSTTIVGQCQSGSTRIVGQRGVQQCCGRGGSTSDEGAEGFDKQWVLSAAVVQRNGAMTCLRALLAMQARRGRFAIKPQTRVPSSSGFKIQSRNPRF
jgi:hypothetical protein